MKNRLKITIDDSLLAQARRYAETHQTSLSKLVEQYFKRLSRSSGKQNIIQLVDQLPKPSFDVNKNLKEFYYDDQKKKTWH